MMDPGAGLLSCVLQRDSAVRDSLAVHRPWNKTGLYTPLSFPRLHSRRAKSSFKHWDNLASALWPLLHEQPLVGRDGAEGDSSSIESVGSSGNGESTATDVSGCGTTAKQLVMPSTPEMVDAAGKELLQAVQHHGGIQAVANRLGATTRRT